MKSIKEILAENRVFSFIGAWTILMFQIGRNLSEDNMIYAVGELHTFDNTLFNHNVYMGAGVISPRFITDHIIAILMKFLGCWANAILVWLLFGVLIEALAISNIAIKINDKKAPLYSVLFALMLAYNQNNLAGFSLANLQSVSLGLASAFAILAVSFVIGEDKNYKLAWIFNGCAAVCQVHEGIYCFAVIFMICIVDSILRKKVMLRENTFIFLAIFCILGVTIPSIFTDKLNISNADFVYIYSVFRHPHHLVPTSWGDITTICKSAWINISLFLLSAEVIYFNKKDKVKRCFYEAVIFTFAWIAAVNITYIFTEKFPVAAISTLFLSKSLKYVVLISLIWALIAVDYAKRNRKFISAYLILFFVFISNTWTIEQLMLCTMFFAVAIFFENTCQSNIRFHKNFYLVLDVVFYVFLATVMINTAGVQKVMITAFIAAVLAGLQIIKEKKTKAYVPLASLAAVMLMLVSLWGRIYTVSADGITLYSGEDDLKATMGDSLYNLARQFKEQTSETTEFLADPDDTSGAGWFQVVSKRNCYVVNKVVPSSKCTVEEWYERCISLSDFEEKSSDEIWQIMEESDIEYALIKSKYFEKFDSDSRFQVYLSSENDSYRIYRR